MAGSFLRQSTASQSRATPPFLDDTDFKTAETALTIANTDVKLIVNGGASADKNSGGGTHRANGVYSLTFDATDTATVGEMEVSIKVAGALPVFMKFWVLEEAVYDALFAALAPGYGTAQTGDSFAIVNSGTHGNAAIKGYVDDIGTAGAGLTAVPWNAAWDAEVQSEVDDALTAYGAASKTNITAATVTLNTTQPAVVFTSLTSTGSFTISDGLLVSRSTSNASAIVATGNGTGSGFVPTGGATGYGINAVGGSTSGAAIRGRTTSGHALDLVALGSRMYGAYLAGPSDGSGGGLVVLGDSATSISDTYGNAALLRVSSASATGNALMLDASVGKHGCALYGVSCDNEAGLYFKGGPSGQGAYFIGGSTNGTGMTITTGGVGSAAIAALSITASGGSASGISVNSSGSGGTAVSLSGHTCGLAIDGSTAAGGYAVTLAGGSSGAGFYSSGKYGIHIASTSHAMYLNNSAGSSIHCVSGAGLISGVLSTLTTYTGNTPQTADHAASVAAIKVVTDNMARSAATIVLGTVGSGSTTTSIVTSSLTPSAGVTDQFKGRIVIFDKATTTANLRGQATDITASTSGGVLTVTALTTAPASTDTFVIA